MAFGLCATVPHSYEWGYTYGPPMAVAPLPSVRRVVEFALTEMPPEKIFLGFPNYAYDWTLPYAPGTTRAQSIGNEAAVQLAVNVGAEIRFDEQAADAVVRVHGRRRAGARGLARGCAEQPCKIPARDGIRPARPRLLELHAPLHGGLRAAERRLPAGAIKRGKGIAILRFGWYNIVSNHQNIGGSCLGTENRRDLARAASRAAESYL